jgi:hypothetical protein
MFKRTALFSLTALIACTGEKEKDAGTLDDTQAEDVSIDFSLNFYDAFTDAALVGAEHCVLEPELGENSCHTTDENGVIEWTWEAPVETNFLSRLTLENYFTTLYLGRYDEEVGASWEALFVDTGVVQMDNYALSDTIINMSLQSAGTAHQDGMGHTLYGLASMDESSMAEAAIELTNEAGEPVGEVLYANEGGTGFDATLETTSSRGVVTIANVPPGTYTLTLVSSDFGCVAGRSWASDVANTVTVVIEADTMTMGSLACAAL